MKKLRLEDAVNIGKEMGFNKFIVIEKETVRHSCNNLIRSWGNCTYNNETISENIKGYEDCGVCTLYLGTYEETTDFKNNKWQMSFPYSEYCIIIYDFWN